MNEKTKCLTDAFSLSIGLLCLSLKSETPNPWPVAGPEFLKKCVSSFFLCFPPFMTLVSTTSEVKLRGPQDFIQN